MSKKIRKWSDEYVQYGFTYIIEPDGSQRSQCTICNAKLSNSSLAPAKLKEHFLKMHGDEKYKNTTLALQEVLFYDGRHKNEKKEQTLLRK